MDLLEQVQRRVKIMIKGMEHLSQNHSMLGVVRNLCGSSSPTSLLKQGHLEQAAQDFVQVGLEYHQKSLL